MATKKTVTKSLDDTPERFRLGELGYSGLNIFDGVSRDELKKELTFPHSNKTYKQMSYHGTINAALTLYDNLISKVDWKVIPPQDATEEEKQQTARVNEMMHDMEQSFSDVVRDVLSMNVYGFSVHEKVFRRRLNSTGSMYNDGIIGWKKLPIRSQESIEKFIFDDDGNEILGVKQDLSAVHDYYNRYSKRTENEVVLPRSKFLLFRSGKHRGDPFGKSMLRDAYLAWRYLTALEEIEANGVARDLQGMPVLKIPPQYMSADASDEQKSIYNYYKNVLRNIQMNSQSGLILPQAIDPDSRQPLFSIELLSTEGKKNFDTTKVKEYYKNLILTSLFADVLTLGQGATGSFALGQLKNSLSGSAAESMIKGITEVFNQDLIKQTYILNGWNPARACRLDFDNLETVDLEAFSKAIQRFASVSALEVDRSTLNRIRESVGIDKLPEDEEPMLEYLPNYQSRSGDGMEKGSGNGTSDNVAGTDTSTENLDNAG
jgi:hypothetical protein